MPPKGSLGGGHSHGRARHFVSGAVTAAVPDLHGAAHKEAGGHNLQLVGDHILSDFMESALAVLAVLFCFGQLQPDFLNGQFGQIGQVLATRLLDLDFEGFFSWLGQLLLRGNEDHGLGFIEEPHLAGLRHAFTGHALTGGGMDLTLGLPQQIAQSIKAQSQFFVALLGLA